ncbi:MAG: helix-turn-helix domain-containing protein [Christensenellales bacterium]
MAGRLANEIMAENQKRDLTQSEQFHMAQLLFETLLRVTAGLGSGVKESCLELYKRLTMFENKNNWKLLSAGINFAEYLSRTPISQAKKLLRPGAEIANVAAAAGYGSAETLCRSFLRYENLTPTEYIKMEKRNQQNSNNKGA